MVISWFNGNMYIVCILYDVNICKLDTALCVFVCNYYCIIILEGGYVTGHDYNLMFLTVLELGYLT